MKNEIRIRRSSLRRRSPIDKRAMPLFEAQESPNLLAVVARAIKMVGNKLFNRTLFKITALCMFVAQQQIMNQWPQLAAKPTIQGDGESHFWSTRYGPRN